MSVFIFTKQKFLETIQTAALKSKLWQIRRQSGLFNKFMPEKIPLDKINASLAF